MLPEIVAGPLLTASVTGNPLEAAGGVTVSVALLEYTWLAIAPKAAITLLPLLITRVLVTGVAALQVVMLPFCEATIVAVPAPSSVTVFPEMEMLVEALP